MCSVTAPSYDVDDWTGGRGYGYPRSVSPSCGTPAIQSAGGCDRRANRPRLRRVGLERPGDALLQCKLPVPQHPAPGQHYLGPGDQAGESPEIVTTGITVTYAIVDNTYSVGKSNFWDYAAHLGWSVTPNVGIAGFGLSGAMKLDGDHFIAEFIPLTEYTDSALSGESVQSYP